MTFKKGTDRKSPTDLSLLAENISRWNVAGDACGYQSPSGYFGIFSAIFGAPVKCRGSPAESAGNPG
jgi:hypothetical protein